jgi:hypothetical protein
MWDAAFLRSDGADTLDGRGAGTAVLTLLQRLLADAPLVVAIDDVQWLDRASARVVAFVVRRLTPGALVSQFEVLRGRGRRWSSTGWWLRSTCTGWHLARRRVYRKLGLRSRAELGAWMATQPAEATPQS